MDDDCKTAVDTMSR